MQNRTCSVCNNEKKIQKNYLKGKEECKDCNRKRGLKR